MSKPKILIQIDPDPHVSTFDSVVAIDSGIDHLLTHDNVTVEQVEGIVHGAMFTRGPQDLRSTALFFGGSNVVKTEAIVEAAKKCFFGPMRVSILSDPNGCNTTASAAVLCAQKHVELSGKTVTILAGTGPVGQRVAQIIAGPATDQAKPPTIRVCSRKIEKAKSVCDQLAQKTSGNFVPVQTGSPEESLGAVEEADVVFGCGAAGVELLPASWADSSPVPSVVVDLNAVPPAGIAGVGVMDSAVTWGNGTICFGAIGVGGFKMKIHKRALQMLFDSNDLVLEVEEIYAIGQSL